MKSMFLGASVVLGALSAAGCGESSSIKPSMSNFKMSVSRGTERPSNLTAFTEAKGAPSVERILGLDAGISVIDWVIKVAGCASGNTSRAESTSLNPIDSISLYNLDEGCQAGLESFGQDGKKFVKVDGGVLSGDAGSEATFREADSGNEYRVSIDTQLASPLTDASRAQFLFFTNDDGNTSQYKKGINVGLGVRGVEPPNFDLSAEKTDYTSMPAGIPNWKFVFVCRNKMINGNCPTQTGDLQAAGQMSVRVVVDTYNDKPKYQDAEAVFALDSGVIAVEDATAGANGGIFAHPVKGTGRLAIDTHLMVFVRYKTAIGSSYRAFNLDIPGL